MDKKKTRRSQAKYPALDPKLNLKTRSDILDFDYIDKLPETWTDPKTGRKWTNDELKQYLNDFSKEYALASFDKKKRVHKKKIVENEKNKDLNVIKKKILPHLKKINVLISDSNIKIKTKYSLKKALSQFKKRLKRIFKEDLSYVEDYYKKDAEKRNNARNSCILTRSKAQGKALAIESLPETNYITKDGVEDTLIEIIDSLNFSKEPQDS